MTSPHYPNITISTREVTDTDALVHKVTAMMRRRSVPRAERLAFIEQVGVLNYEDAVAAARQWVVILTPHDLVRWNLGNVRLRPGLERETLVLNPATRFARLGTVPTLHLRRCAMVRQAHRVKAFNASAKTAFESERARREAGEWPSMAFCRRCLVEKIR